MMVSISLHLLGVGRAKSVLNSRIDDLSVFCAYINIGRVIFCDIILFIIQWSVSLSLIVVYFVSEICFMYVNRCLEAG